LPRLFISHSSKDNVDALAFRRWLAANGWAESEVFIDLHGIGAGARWRETLRKANVACEAVVLLASPNSLASVEYEKELELAEALGKPIIPAIVRDLTVKHPRLAPWADRQIVDLSQQPTEPIEPFEYEGKLHRVGFSVAALASIKARLADLGIASGSFAREPCKRPDGKDTGPYPGLAAFGEFDAGIFFGCEADIVAGLAKLRLMRKRRSPRLFVIQAASGAGKSSFLKAGLWPRLKRDPDFAPLCILHPAQGILTGPDGIGHRIAPWFERQRRTAHRHELGSAVGTSHNLDSVGRGDGVVRLEIAGGADQVVQIDLPPSVALNKPSAHLATAYVDSRGCRRSYCDNWRRASTALCTRRSARISSSGNVSHQLPMMESSSGSAPSRSLAM
jgi:hypothetical protein